MPVLATLLISLSPVTTEVFAPAMTLVGRGAAEGSVSLFLCVTAGVHLLTGLLADRFSPTLVTTAAVLVYGTASAALAMGAAGSSSSSSSSSPSSFGLQFSLLRASQAVGAAACAVVGLARVRTHGLAMHRVQAGRGMVLVCAPMISQVLVTAYGTWRAVFAALAVLSVWMLLLLLLLLMARRTSREDDGRNAHTPLPLAQVPSSSPPSLAPLLGWILGEAFGFAGLLVWVSHAPFVASASSSSEDVFGFWYGLTFVGSVLGAWTGGGWVASFPVLGFCTASLLAAAVPLFVVVVVPSQPSSSVITGVMTLANAARAHASTHAQAQILAHARRGRTGRTAGLAHASRALAASAAVAVATHLDAWLVLVSCHLAAAGTVMMVVAVGGKANAEGVGTR